jgi:hypothetical protein
MASKRVEDDLGSSLSFAADVNTGFPALFVQDTRRERLVHLGGSDLSAADLLQAVDDHI